MGRVAHVDLHRPVVCRRVDGELRELRRVIEGQHQADSRLEPAEVATVVARRLPHRRGIAVGDVADVCVVLLAITGGRVERANAGDGERLGAGGAGWRAVRPGPAADQHAGEDQRGGGARGGVASAGTPAPVTLVATVGSRDGTGRGTGTGSGGAARAAASNAARNALADG